MPKFIRRIFFMSLILLSNVSLYAQDITGPNYDDSLNIYSFILDRWDEQIFGPEPQLYRAKHELYGSKKRELQSNIEKRIEFPDLAALLIRSEGVHHWHTFISVYKESLERDRKYINCKTIKNNKECAESYNRKAEYYNKYLRKQFNEKLDSLTFYQNKTWNNGPISYTGDYGFLWCGLKNKGFGLFRPNQIIAHREKRKQFLKDFYKKYNHEFENGSIDKELKIRVLPGFSILEHNLNPYHFRDEIALIPIRSDTNLHISAPSPARVQAANNKARGWISKVLRTGGNIDDQGHSFSILDFHHDRQKPCGYISPDASKKIVEFAKKWAGFVKQVYSDYNIVTRLKLGFFGFADARAILGRTGCHLPDRHPLSDLSKSIPFNMREDSLRQSNGIQNFTIESLKIINTNEKLAVFRALNAYKIFAEAFNEQAGSGTNPYEPKTPSHREGVMFVDEGKIIPYFYSNVYSDTGTGYRGFDIVAYATYRVENEHDKTFGDSYLFKMGIDKFIKEECALNGCPEKANTSDIRYKIIKAEKIKE